MSDLKFQVTCDGKPAEVSITPAGALATGFTGVLTTQQYGTGQIKGTVTGTTYTGTVSVDGYDADFSATVADGKIEGTVSYGIFFSQSFSGTQVVA